MAPSMTIPTPVLAWDPYVLPYHDYIVHYRDETLKWIGLYTEPEKTWRRLEAKFHWSGSADTRDDMFMTFDVVNITAGAIDGTWTTTDYTTVEGKFDTFFSALAVTQSNNISLTEYRWYVSSYNTPDNPKPFAPHGAPERVTTKAVVGVQTGFRQAPQVSTTITWITPFPKNWGRNYIPGVAAIDVTAGVPTLAISTVDAVCTAAQNLNATLHSSDFQLVVPITRLGVGARGDPGIGATNRRLSSIIKTQVDNVYDVQRKRRIHTPTYRKRLP